MSQELALPKKAFLAAVLAAGSIHVMVADQKAPQNINVNSSIPNPGSPSEQTADPFRQRTVEPTIAVSPLNSEHIMVAANDYRIVDFFDDMGTAEGTQLARRLNLSRPGILAAVKDAWIGLYFSYDRGQHWINMLHPGHAFDESTLGQNLAISGRTAGTDPVLAAAPGSAHFYLGGMYFDRGGFSQLAVTRLTDLNDDSKHPIVIDYGRIRVVEQGSASATGNFADKGHITADVARLGAAFGKVFFTYTLFTGNAGSNQVRVVVSSDGGNTWTNPKKVSGTLSPNQGSFNALNRKTGVDYIFWRTFNPNRIVWVKTADGKTVSSPMPVGQLGQTTFCAYDAQTQGPPNPDLARTLAFPAAAFDNNNRVHVVYQARELQNGQCTSAGMPRIFLTTGTVHEGTGNIISWTTPVIVDAAQRCEMKLEGEGPTEVPCTTQGATPRPAGPQWKPVISHSGGKLLIAYKEGRIDDDPATPDPPGLVNGFPSGIERRVDMRAARINLATFPTPGSVTTQQVSRYDFESATGEIVQSNTDMPDVHRENVRAYQAGSRGFGGDYEGIADFNQFVTGSPWRWAIDADVPSPSFGVVWYDTRNIRFPGDNINGNWMAYTKPGEGSPGSCNPGSRDTSIYFAEADPGIVVSAPQTFKQMGPTNGQVTYAVRVRNRSLERRQFKLTLIEGDGVDASWEQFSPEVDIIGFGTTHNPDGSCPANSLPSTCTPRLVIVPRSSATLTAFAIGPDPSPPNAITVKVEDVTPGIAQLLPIALLRLNPAPQNNIPDATLDETHTPGMGTPTVKTSTDSGGPSGAPGMGTPGMGTPGMGTPGMGTSGLTEYTDVVFTVSNDQLQGATLNTTSGFNAFINLANESEIAEKHLLQLIILQPASNPTVKDCDLFEVIYDQLISFIPGNPGMGTPGMGTPGMGTPGMGTPGMGTPGMGTAGISNATFTLAPSTAVGASHQAGGTPHSLRDIDKKLVVARAWHCRQVGGCTVPDGTFGEPDGMPDHLDQEMEGEESFPTTDAQVAAAVELLVVSQAVPKTGGVVDPASPPIIVSSGADVIISAPATLTVTPSIAFPGESVQLSAYTVKNQGKQSTGVGFENGYYLSQDDIFDGNDSGDIFLGEDSSGALGPGASANFAAPNVTIPSWKEPGTYHLLIVLDHENDITGVPEFRGNNVETVPITVGFVPDTQFAVAGLGGLRGGSGSGSISISGVSGTITKALLYWHGPTNSSDANANANITFNGTPIGPGTSYPVSNIGFANDNNWAMTNSQAYRADVTSLVSVSQTSYTVSNLRKLSDASVVADINGVTLLVFFNVGSSPSNRTVYVYDGNDSNGASTFEGGGATGWSRSMSGINYGSGTATLQLLVGDGQKGTSAPPARQWEDGELILNGTTLASQGHIFSGDSVQGSQTNPGAGSSGGLWDIKSFSIDSFLSPGSNTLTLTSPYFDDFLSLIVAVVSVPPGS